VSGDDGALAGVGLGQRVVAPVEPQSRGPGGVVGAVALEATIGEDRPAAAATTSARPKKKRMVRFSFRLLMLSCFRGEGGEAFASACAIFG